MEPGALQTSASASALLIVSQSFLKRVLDLQVDPSLRMEIAERAAGSARGALFQLHSPVVLNG